MDSLIKDHPFNKTEDLGNGLKVTTEIHADYDGGVTKYDAHPEDFANMDWYGVVVTISRNGQKIGSGSLWGIATDDYTDDYLNEVAKENRDEALDGTSRSRDRAQHTVRRKRLRSSLSGA
jgi:hypothetical protein